MTPGTARRSSLPLAAGPSTRRRLASSTWTCGPCRRHAMSAAKRNTPAAQGSGSLADDRPAGAVRRVGQPVLETGHGRPLCGRAGGPPRPSRCAPPAMRWPSVMMVSAASSQSPTGSTYGTPSPGSPVPPGRAPAAPCARRCRRCRSCRGSPPGPWRTTPARRRPGRRSRPRPAAGVPAVDEPERQPAEDRRVRDPVQGGVQERAPRPAGALASAPACRPACR